MQTSAAPPVALRGTNFYRNPARAAVLMFFADLAYLWWWLWQFFLFTKREGFPRTRSFWWLLVPFYGLYVLYQQLDDLKRALEATSNPEIEPSTFKKHWFVVVPEVTALLLALVGVSVVNALFLGNVGIIKLVVPLAASGGVAYLVRRNRQARQATFNPALLAALMSIGAVSIIPTVNPLFFFALALLLGYLDSSGAIAMVFSVPITAIMLGLVLAAAAYSTQGAANEFLHARYPEERGLGFTPGEIVAALLGLLLNILYFYWQFYPVEPRALFETRVAPAGAPYTYRVPAGFHEATVELPSEVNGLSATGLDSDKYSDTRDVILVFVHPLSESVNGVPLSDIKQTMDTSMSLGPKAQSFVSRGWAKIAGVDALEYDFVGQETPYGVADGIVYLIFNGKNELELDCRWVASDKAEFVRGCDEVKRTLTFN